MFRSKRRKIGRLDFILAGAQKSGSTALHYFLSRHPDICMGDQQEIHFFDNDAMFVAEPNYEELHKHYPSIASATIAGDCTPSYLYHEPAMQRIWNYNPKIKLLILLRNPVERAFAHWNMQQYKGIEPLDFFDEIKKKKRALPARGWSATLCLSGARILWTATRARLQIFSPRANEGREVRRFQRQAARNACLNLLVPRA